MCFRDKDVIIMKGINMAIFQLTSVGHSHFSTVLKASQLSILAQYFFYFFCSLSYMFQITERNFHFQEELDRKSIK